VKDGAKKAISLFNVSMIVNILKYIHYHGNKREYLCHVDLQLVYQGNHPNFNQFFLNLPISAGQLCSCVSTCLCAIHAVSTSYLICYKVEQAKSFIFKGDDICLEIRHFLIVLF